MNSTAPAPVKHTHRNQANQTRKPPWIAVKESLFHLIHGGQVLIKGHIPNVSYKGTQ